MTLDEIGERQFARNELICTCLSRSPLPDDMKEVLRSHMMDRRGEGVPVILSATRKLAGEKPEYRLLDDAELMLTLPSAPLDDKDKLHGLVSEKLPNRQNNLFSAEKNLVQKDENLVWEATDGSGKKGFSRPTMARISALREHVGSKSFGLAEIAELMPRSSAIRLLAKMKAAGMVKQQDLRGKYRFAAYSNQNNGHQATNNGT